MRNTRAQHDSLNAFCARRRRTIDVILTDISQIVLPTRIEANTLLCFVRRNISVVFTKFYPDFDNIICLAETRWAVSDGQRHISHSDPASTFFRIIIRKFMQDLKVDSALDAIRCPECSSIIRLIRMGNTVLNRYVCPNCG